MQTMLFLRTEKMLFIPLHLDLCSLHSEGDTKLAVFQKIYSDLTLDALN